MAKAGARALASSHALSPLPALSPWARLADAARFILRPTPYALRHGWNAALLGALAAVFAGDLALDWAVGEIIARWDAAAGFLPTPLERGEPLAEELFYALAVAPLLEEAVYRGWLTGRVAALRFALFGLAAEACFIGALWASEAFAGPLGMAGAALALAGFAQWLMTRQRDRAIPAWFARNFHWLVWGSSLAFALVHLGNYTALSHPLGVLVVAPQLIGGLCLAYVRTRLGLRAAMVHHAAYNALFLAVEAAA